MEYFVGFDIGTESVGWAVTNTEYKIAKVNGKALWGTRVFSEALKADERRAARTGRRRYERRRQRLDWLQNVFAEEIGKKDPGFFQRLEESKFREEDKCSEFPLGRYTLFSSKEFSDQDYYKKYPTIYHLRNALMQETGPFDVRLVYLAIHHIMKNRGHFLFDDLSMDAVTFANCWGEVKACFEELFDESIELADSSKFSEIMCDRNLNISNKAKKLQQFAGNPAKGSQFYTLIELLAGKTVSLKSLYGVEEEFSEKSKISFTESFEDSEAILQSQLGDRMELLIATKKVYDWALLDRMLHGKSSISQAKIEDYQKHKSDLKLLKQLFKQHNRALYREMFLTNDEKLNNYIAYSGHKAVHRCGMDDFYKYLRAKLKNLGEQIPEVKSILNEIDLQTFLPKQTNKDNGVIPHQLHEFELRKILENAGRYLPFLNETDESGLTKSEQIIAMFCFRIPYYVGPLNKNSSHGWIVRSDEKIFPWNFEQVVDLEKSAEKFITRMTAKCSYLGEDVLPKDSLLYSKFMVLNELNNLRVNGEKIPVALKQQIYNDIFLKKKKVTPKALKNYLISQGKADQQAVLSGIDEEIKASLAPWIDYNWMVNRENGIAMTEDIIRHIVLFGADRKMLARWLNKQYGNVLTPEEQKKALSVKYSGWGRLSREFLEDIHQVNCETGEVDSIIDALWNTNDNLMELLSVRYTFGQAVEAYRREKMDNARMTLQDYLDESYASPGIKRAIHQTIAIMAEIEKIMKQPPKRIFIEMAREEGEKDKRTVSRKDQLLKLYHESGWEGDELYSRLADLDEGALRRDKLYLYYSQHGKCMYSGEPIAFTQLDSDYDIDHIYPQSKTKDDSLNNRVLVKRGLNAQKSDSYPLSREIREKMRPYWEMLRSTKAISEEKFRRLVRVEPFHDDELAGFINRQLVETRQSTKLVAELLQRRYQERTEIVYVKAGNVSSFRQDQRLDADGRKKQAADCGKNEKTVQDPLFVKCREINDYHHAKDAYLNIVVGNIYHLKFTKNPLYFIQREKAKYSLNKMYAFDVVRNGEVGWKAGEDGSIAMVRWMMSKNNILFTRRNYEVKGKLFDLQLVAKGKGQLPAKTSDSRLSNDKYGGYNKLTGAFFILVEHTYRKKRVRSLETVFLMYTEMYHKDPERYCREILGLQQTKILIPKLNIDSLVSFDVFRMHLSGRTGKQIIFKNANQLVLEPVWHQYIKNISKYLAQCKAIGTDLPVTVFNGMTAEKNEELYLLLLSKLQNPRYQVRLSTAANTVQEQTEKFKVLSLANQCRILIQILNLFANNASSADFKLLNGKAGIGILLLSKNLENYNGHSLKLIYQSVTGFFEQQVDLLPKES